MIKDYPDNIQQAVKYLKAGKLVAFPTETVYGLGAHARQPEAITKIFLAKQRPFTHPLIVHLAHLDQLAAWAIDIPAEAYLLANTYWPGPLTLVLKKHPAVSTLLTGGQDTIGLRIPAHPLALALLQALGEGIAAPSANRFCRLSPTTAAAVFEELGKQVDYILAGDACQVGIESTIVDLSGQRPAILRPGMITAQQLETILEKPLATASDHAPRVAGMHPVHYAPETPLLLIPAAEISTFLENLTNIELPIAVLAQHTPSRQDVAGPADSARRALVQNPAIHWFYMAATPQEYAHDLYCTLRELDKQGFKKILVVAPPHDPAWAGIHDRLQKAASRA